MPVGDAALVGLTTQSQSRTIVHLRAPLQTLIYQFCRHAAQRERRAGRLEQHCHRHRRGRAGRAGRRRRVGGRQSRRSTGHRRYRRVRTRANRLACLGPQARRPRCSLIGHDHGVTGVAGTATGGRSWRAWPGCFRIDHGDRRGRLEHRWDRCRRIQQLGRRGCWSQHVRQRRRWVSMSGNGVDGSSTLAPGSFRPEHPAGGRHRRVAACDRRRRHDPFPGPGVCGRRCYRGCDELAQPGRVGGN